MGDDTIYSGTVAAAIEGHLFNLPAIAVSLPGGGKRRFDTAAAFARDFAARLLAAKIDPNRPPPLFNINAPDVPPEAVRGARLTRLGRRHTAEKSKRIRDGEDEFWFEFGEAGDARDAGPETDFHAVERGFVSVTPLTGRFDDARCRRPFRRGGAVLRARRRVRRKMTVSARKPQPDKSDRIIADALAARIDDAEVVDAFRRVPRRVFLSAALAMRAADDDALPIGFGQTTSQPFVIAKMLEMARRGKRAGRALEIGAGCGYQTALLAELFDEVFAVERVAALGARARRALAVLGCDRIRLKYDDGMNGIPQAAPFDAIVVAAESDITPPSLLAQLAPGARLVLPLRARAGGARLTAVDRDNNTLETADPVRFVPLLPGVE